MARVELEKVTKFYPGAVKAVDSLDLRIADREFVVLVGPSGCGKSTTLRMVAGLEAVSGGLIRIGDRVVNDIAPKDRDVAMVFQNYALYPHMTVYNNMAFGLKMRRVPRAETRQRVTEVARVLDIEHLLDRKPKALSGGQRQRVAVGRAIVREPAAFLFDEPLSNLDARLRVTTRAELKRLHQRLRTTTIYVTHDQEEAMTLGDRVVVMKDGRVQQADTPMRTYNEPANRFVAGFIGMPPMNFFDGAVKMVDGRMVFEEGRLDVGRPAGPPAYHGRPPPAGGNGSAGGGGELTLPGNGFRLPVPRTLAERLAGYVGRHVVLGIRPEHLTLRPIDAAGGTPVAALSMKVRVAEPLGRDVDVYLSTDLSDRVVARVEAPGPGEALSEMNSITTTSPAASAPSGPPTDARVTLYVDLRRVHFFEPGETGTNLSRETTLSSSPPTSTSEPAHALA